MLDCCVHYQWNFMMSDFLKKVISEKVNIVFDVQLLMLILALILQPLPVLNDDVLVEICGYTNWIVLYNMAICSRRFQQVAKRAFVEKLEGRLTLTNRGNDRTLLRIFGAYAKRFDCPTEIKISSEVVWSQLNTAKLKIMAVDPFQLCLNRNFGQLTHLELSRDISEYPVPKFNLNFIEYMPQLVNLVIRGCMTIDCPRNFLPCKLQSLELHMFKCVLTPVEKMLTPLLSQNTKLKKLVISASDIIGYPDRCVEIIEECSTYRTLETLTLQMERFITTPQLKLCQELNQLEVSSCNKDNLIEFIELTTHLRKLNVLKIELIDWDEYAEDILMPLAAIAPANLKFFTIVGYGPPKNWNSFVAAMPLTCKCTYDGPEL